MSDINERIAKVKGWHPHMNRDETKQVRAITEPFRPIWFDDDPEMLGGNIFYADWENLIADADTLIDDLVTKGYTVGVATQLTDQEGSPHFSRATVRELPGTFMSTVGAFVAGENADTRPRAICLAWLAVMEQDNG